MAFIHPKQLINSSVMSFSKKKKKKLRSNAAKNAESGSSNPKGLFGSKFGHSMAQEKFDISFRGLASILFQRNRILSSEYLFLVLCVIAAPMRWRTQCMHYGAANC